MRKRLVVLALVVLAVFCLTSCGKDVIKMDLNKVYDSVVFNRSMTGVGDVFSNHIKTVIDFKDDDPKKMDLITNTYNYGQKPVDKIQIQNGKYVEAMSEDGGQKTCRGILVFLEFGSTEEATAAISTIEKNMNKAKSADGVYNLNLFGVVQNKNDLMVYYLRDSLAQYELSRVFQTKDYVK